ncbi:MAG: hypothetical protein H6895_15065 [Defluviimonas sp.]|uniref:DUF7742 family protein n=1 Tax=Albidovulum sp. TaxID=1872424 RepID=UPI001D2AB410|nr:hypothetical protein [Paracoccaceae bacterium]MCC0065383.1 hypothetical protein [Defluviimonas sp.]
MRTITSYDIGILARLAEGLAEPAARAMVRGYAERAHVADRFRKRFGRLHPFWGNGSLASAVLAERDAGPERFPSSPQHLAAMALVIDVLIDWRRRV